MSVVESLVLNTVKLFINDVESLVENPASSSIKFVADTGARSTFQVPLNPYRFLMQQGQLHSKRE